MAAGQWIVRCEKSRFSNKPSNVRQTVYVRAGSKELAERIGKVATGLKHAFASEYFPERDPAFRGYIVAVV